MGSSGIGGLDASGLGFLDSSGTGVLDFRNCFLDSFTTSFLGHFPQVTRILFSFTRAVCSPMTASDDPAGPWGISPLKASGPGQISIYLDPEPWRDPTSRTPNSGLQYSSGVDYGALWWILFLDPPGALRTGELTTCVLLTDLA